MPAERVGSSPGWQGKAIPVEETAVQLSLPIASNPTRISSPVWLRSVSLVATRCGAELLRHAPGSAVFQAMIAPPRTRYPSFS